MVGISGGVMRRMMSFSVESGDDGGGGVLLEAILCNRILSSRYDWGGVWWWWFGSLVSLGECCWDINFGVWLATSKADPHVSHPIRGLDSMSFLLRQELIGRGISD